MYTVALLLELYYTSEKSYKTTHFLNRCLLDKPFFLRNFHLKCPRSPLIFGYLETTSRFFCLLHPDVRHSTHSLTKASIPVPHRDPSITLLHTPALHSWKPKCQHEKVYVAEAGVNVRGRGWRSCFLTSWHFTKKYLLLINNLSRNYFNVSHP